MKTYYAWIAHDDQHGGDTTITAKDAGDALSQAMAWAAKGKWQAGDRYDVNVQQEDTMHGNRLEPEVGTTVTVE